ncbi:TRAP transporter small permease [Marilutibacter alkalisoli]|uniref:TRAP transporter small permease protein n=1 Tax=Marilutibacter alkalisoli TaxID=2591633 RepID=A0A514BNB6_9GAMM|nr:TRAP transporter small permease [Lysobacter alkalisoli]QDH68894.1 TRAP transporter small permease [Lysobacter alkalisoli]
MNNATSPDTVDTPRPLHARVLDRIASLSIGIAGASLLGLVVVQGWQVFARYVLNSSPSWTEPVTLLLLATCMSLGAAAAVREDRHFRFHLLVQLLPPSLHRAADALAALVVIAIGGVLATWGARLLVDGFDIRMAGAPLPQSIPFLPLTVGGVLMVVFAAARLLAGGTAPTSAASPEKEA